MEGKLVEKSSRYEITPFVLVLPAIPTFPGDFLPEEPGETGEYPLPQAMQLVGANTRVHQIRQIQRETEEILKRYQKRLRLGDRKALDELLDINPAFIRVPWVAEAYLRFKRSGLSLRRRGRPKRYKHNPLIIAGLVKYLIGKKLVLAPFDMFETTENVSGTRTEMVIRNPEQAFHALEELGVLSYEQAKRAYYRALQNRHIRAVLIENAEGVGVPSMREVEDLNAQLSIYDDQESQPIAVIKKISVVSRTRNGISASIIEATSPFSFKRVVKEDGSWEFQIDLSARATLVGPQ